LTEKLEIFKEGRSLKEAASFSYIFSSAVEQTKIFGLESFLKVELKAGAFLRFGVKV
jgi:hypothetical protein